ncbi:MAG TPA: hypothetical protein VKP65_15535 [Rhodothermales bacterium]|nr:hypothetical protein [Rhodothermales bacterium]
MLNKALLTCAALYLFTGCTSTRTFDLRTATDDTFYEFNAEAERKEARVTLTGYPPQSALEVEVRADSTFWRDPRTGRPRSVPTTQISEISFRKSQFVRGAVVGGSFGAIAALGLGQDCSEVPEGQQCYGRLDLLPFTALAMGVVGGAISARGRERFLFIVPPE